MNNEQYWETLHEVIFTAGMNLRYHQRKEAVWGLWNFVLKASICVVAVASALLSVSPVPGEWSILAWLGLVVSTIALNVTPFDQKAKFHGEMFQSWNALYGECNVCKRNIDIHVENGQDGSVCWLDYLCNRENELHSREPLPDVNLLKQCENEQRQSLGFTI